MTGTTVERRIGLVGAGWVAPHHLKAWQQLRGRARIVAIVDPRNGASMRVLEKLGFGFEKMVRLTPDDDALKLFASEPPR